jgi:glutamate synthase (NADPH) small chain
VFAALRAALLKERAVANDPMLKFISKPQAYPHKRDAEMRAEDFAEIADRYAPDAAADQASRCSQCGVPYCSVHCPLHNHIPDWLRLTAEGRLREAYELSNLTSTMPEICGRICPQDRLCEGNCVIEFAGHDAVTIGSVEKYITDTAWEQGWVEPVEVGPSRGQSVGIIGAGPGGLTTAEYLRVAGYDVNVYDRYDRMGGLLTYGIPGFKLEKTCVMRRVQRLEDAASFSTRISKWAAMRHWMTCARSMTPYLSPPACTRRGRFKRRGSGLDGIVPALDFLTISNRKGFGDAVPAFDSGALNARAKTSSSSAAATPQWTVSARRPPRRKSVKCLYRRDRDNMPGSQREVTNAEEEGVEFVWLSGPKGFDGDGKVQRVHVAKMRLAAPDASGRRTPENDPEGDFTLNADMVITALGFEAEDLPVMFNAPDLNVTRWGTLRVDHKTQMTNLDGVFAVGDIVRGASLVVWAIRDGRDVTQHMHNYLKSKASRERQAA